MTIDYKRLANTVSLTIDTISGANLSAREDLKQAVKILDELSDRNLRITYSLEDGLFLQVKSPSGKQGGIKLDTDLPILKEALMELAENLDKGDENDK